MTRSVLVVEDHEGAALGLAAPLRDRYEVTVARTVAEALAALAATAFSAVVLDLLLDAPATELHRELLLRRTPVVVVSGLEADAARTIAQVWGAPLLLKPPTDTEILAAVDRAAARNAPTETPSMPDRPSPDPRASIVPDLPPAPASIAPREAPLPAPPPAAQFTPSGRPVNVPVVVQAIDRLGDIVGVIAVAHLCGLGKIGGVEACIVIGAILGVGTGLRQAGARVGAAPGLSVVGLLLLGFARWLAPAAAGAELARASGLLGLLAVLAVGTGCPRVIREPAVPSPAPGCDAGATTCHQGAPFRCGPGGQWSQADRACGRLTSDAGAVVCCATPSALRAGAIVHACVPTTLCTEAAR